MDDYSKDVKIFKALCDEKRLAILNHLKSGEKCACVLIEIRPPAICVKMFGSVMNTSPGPASGSTPNAKQEGITISPAISATQVSRSTMLTDSPARERFLSR